jgi:hypothetical protein
MSPDVEHALALWRVYDLAVIEERRATAVGIAAMMRWHPPKSRRRALPPEAAASSAASIRMQTTKLAAMNAYRAAGLVFDETPNEGRAADAISPIDPPEPVTVGTREPRRFGMFGGDCNTPRRTTA